MVSASEFVDGADVEWRRLGRTLMGATFGAIFTGWASLVLGVSDVFINVFEWLGEFLGRFVEIVAGSSARFLGQTWAGVAEFIQGTGPIALVLAIAFVLVTFYGVVRVVRLA